MNEPTHAYIAKRSCGCMVFASMDDPRLAKDNAREIASCIREGFTVERVPVEEARKLPFGCECCKKEGAK